MSTDVPALPHQDASLPPGVAAYMIPGNGPEPDEQPAPPPRRRRRSQREELKTDIAVARAMAVQELMQAKNRIAVLQNEMGLRIMELTAAVREKENEIAKARGEWLRLQDAAACPLCWLLARWRSRTADREARAVEGTHKE